MKKLGTLLKSFYESPFPKGKRDQAWLDRAKVCRKLLSDCWVYGRQVRRRQLNGVQGIGWTDADIEADVALFAADQSPEYKAEVEAETAAVRAAISAAKTSTQKVANHQTQWGDDTPTKLELPVERIKPKTRSAESQGAGDVESKDRTDQQPRHTITVSSETLRIFSRMFPSKADATFKGVIRWPQFVAAMADAGCSATHNGGSAVSFDGVTNEHGQCGGSIVFHKPHPDSEVDLIMLQTMGKRLRKWFGWDREMFVERGK